MPFHFLQISLVTRSWTRSLKVNLRAPRCYSDLFPRDHLNASGEVPSTGNLLQASSPPECCRFAQELSLYSWCHTFYFKTQCGQSEGIWPTRVNRELLNSLIKGISDSKIIRLACRKQGNDNAYWEIKSNLSSAPYWGWNWSAISTKQWLHSTSSEFGLTFQSLSLAQSRREHFSC